MNKKLLTMFLCALMVTASSVVVYAEDDIVVDANQADIDEEIELDEVVAVEEDTVEVEIDETTVEDTFIDEELSEDGMEVVEASEEILPEGSDLELEGSLGGADYTLTPLANGNYKLSLTAEEYTMFWGEVGSYFAENADKIEEVYIEKNISSIGSEAFKDLTSLKKVTAGDYYYEKSDYGCKLSLEVEAFAGCTSLENVELPISFFGIRAFENCSKLKTVTSKIVTNKSIRTIQVYPLAFGGCTSLEKVTLLASGVSIAPGAFEDANKNLVVTAASGRAHKAVEEAGFKFEVYTGADYAPATLDANHKVKALSAADKELDLSAYLKGHVLPRTAEGMTINDFDKQISSEDESIVTIKDGTKLCFVKPGFAKVKVSLVDYPDVCTEIIVNAYEPVKAVTMSTPGTKISTGSTATIKATVKQKNVDSREIAWQVYEKKNGKLQKTPLTTASGIYVETVKMENGVTTGKLTVKKNPKNAKGEKITDFVVRAVSVANYNDGKTEKTKSNDFVYGSAEYVTEKVSYNIAFNGNGATSGSTKKMSSCKFGTKYVLSNNGFVKKGYTFVGWNTKKDGKGDSFNNKERVANLSSVNGRTVTLYAQWELNKYNIKFDGNGATSGTMKAMNGVGYDKKVKLSANKFKKNGYTFVGWNTKKNGKGKMYNNKQSVKNLSEKNGATVKLYAIWKKK